MQKVKSSTSILQSTSFPAGAIWKLFKSTVLTALLSFWNIWSKLLHLRSSASRLIMALSLRRSLYLTRRDHICLSGSQKNSAVDTNSLDNGKVERSHRKDNEYFYASHKFYSFSDFQKQLVVHSRKYNHFPIRPLSWLDPLTFLAKYRNQTSAPTV